MPLKLRCSFVTFMPNKPDKYSVKFWVLADVETKYISNIDVNLGAQEKEQSFGTSLAEFVVVNLCKHIKRKGYNITCDNFFTSLLVAEKLARDKLSIVGTMQKNRPELCKKMTESENKARYSSNFYWHDPTNFLFVKYQAKEKKSVCLLSSRHDSADVDTSNENKKPGMILFYSTNKVGVACFDQMARLYTTRSASRRWLVAVWGNILDIAAINSYVLYKKVASNHITHQQFILMLVENLLAKPEPCLSNSNRQLRGYDEGVQKQRKCYDVCCDIKTVSTCILCQKSSCGKCSQDNFRVTYVKCLACVKLTT